MRRKTRGHRPTNAGFTLIEVLVVVAIIALLIAILMPSLGGARDQARRVQCLSNLQQIGRAFHTYAADQRGILCSGQSDVRRGYILPESFNTQDEVGIHRIGWMADMVRFKLGRPADLRCATNVGQQIKAFSDYWDGTAPAPRKLTE